MSLLLLLGGSSDGTAGAHTPTGSSGVAVVASREYSIYAEFRAASAARSCRVGVEWFDSGGTSLRTDTTPSVTDSTTGWTVATTEVVSPSTAAFASIYVEILNCSAAEVHYVDKIGLLEPAQWVLPE